MENFAENSVIPVTDAQNSDNSVVISPKVSLYAGNEKFGENDDTPVTDASSDPRYSDAGNAQRLAQTCGKNILYVVEAKEYYVWDETRWCRDAGDVMMLRFAKAVSEQMFEEANTLPEEERKSLRTFALKSQDSGRLKAMVVLAKMFVRNVRYNEFDQHPMLFNVLNGTLDLTTGKLLEPRRPDLITVKTPVKFDPEDKFPEWDDILMDWMQGDREKVRYLQRMAGYAMTGLTDEEILDILWGPGRNGKTKFYKTIYNVLGDDCYAKAANFDSFVVSKGDAGMPNDIAGWRGKRLIVASEGEHSKRLAEAKLKLVTGGDPVVGEFKYQEEFTYDPTYKVWLVSNPKPRIVGTDDAIWSRVHFVSWNRFFAEHERDPKLQDKLTAHLSAILNWMLEGCLEWQRQGLNPPASMREKLAQYRRNQDTIGRFVDDEFIVGEGFTSPKRVTYNAYKRWAEEVGEHYILTLSEFNEKMQGRFTDSRSGSIRFWKGFRLKHEIDPVMAETGHSYEGLEKAIQ